MSETVSATAHAGRVVGHELADAILDYMVPLGAGLSGIAVGQGLFGGDYVATAITGTTGSLNITAATANRIGGIIVAAILGAIGFAFLHLRKAGGWMVKLIGGSFGGFFAGTALRYAISNALLATPLPSGGLIGAMGAGFNQVAQGG